jgi:aminoglycoside phosphotransferase (APT) family kinase protein
MPMPPLGELVARGTRSAVYAFGRDAVIKIPDRTTPEHWIVAEARYADAVRAAGAPAPRLLGLEQVDGRSASVWEWIRGPSMWQDILAAPRRAAQHGRALAELQLSLFALRPPLILPTQRVRLITKIRRSALMIDSALGAARERLPARRGPLRVCHGDLHPGNVILSADGPVIIDWFDASRGDPRADVARSCLLLRRAPSDAEELPHLPGATPAVLDAFADAYLARIRSELPVGDLQLRRWAAVEAVARLAEGAPQAGLLEVWRSGGHGVDAATEARAPSGR